MKTIFEQIKAGQCLATHDELVNNHSIIIQYYYMKALKIANPEAFKIFVNASSVSTLGPKKIFHNILSMYSHTNSHDLDYNHTPDKGLPHLAHYIVACQEVFNDTL